MVSNILQKITTGHILRQWLEFLLAVRAKSGKSFSANPVATLWGSILIFLMNKNIRDGNHSQCSGTYKESWSQGPIKIVIIFKHLVDVSTRQLHYFVPTSFMAITLFQGFITYPPDMLFWPWLISAIIEIVFCLYFFHGRSSIQRVHPPLSITSHKVCGFMAADKGSELWTLQSSFGNYDEHTDSGGGHSE